MNSTELRTPQFPIKEKYCQQPGASVIKRLSIFSLSMLLFSCNPNAKNNEENNKTKIEKTSIQIAAMLDSFNVAAAKANYEKYFNFYTEDATFIGTDATEHWNKQAFKLWAKPYFDKKTTWNFHAIDRHIYIDKSGELAWFDELLNTQMKICRGSGVVIKQNNEWKIQQYVLSMTIPNNLVDTIVKLKTPLEDSVIKKLKKK